MNSGVFEISLSPIDEERFGFRTARAQEVTLDTLPEALDFCQANGVDWLIARCRVDQLKTAQAMEREGFALMDTLVYYMCDLSETPMPSDSGQALVRPVRPGDEFAVEAIAREAFRGYFGHYHADERLERAKCDEVYPSWAARACLSRDEADNVLVAELEGSIVGFHYFRLENPEEVEGQLGGVARSAQRRGVLTSLFIGRHEWAVSNGVVRLSGSTQLSNFAIQKIVARLGYEFSHAVYTFHKWFV